MVKIAEAVQKDVRKVNKLNFVMPDSDPLIFSPRSDISYLYQRQEILIPTAVGTE